MAIGMMQYSSLTFRFVNVDQTNLLTWVIQEAVDFLSTLLDSCSSLYH